MQKNPLSQFALSPFSLSPYFSLSVLFPGLLVRGALAGADALTARPGANDVANAFATSVGSKTLKMWHAIVVSCGVVRCGVARGRATCVARSVRERARAREREQEPIYPQRALTRPAPLLGDAMPRPPAARVEVGVLMG